MDRAVEVIGVGRDNLRAVPIDSRRRMDVTALREILARDIAAGHTPVAVVATAGTTLTVRRDGVAVAVTPQPRASGYGDDTLSWEIPTLAAGSVYEVHVGVRGAASVDYEVRPTTCAHY